MVINGAIVSDLDMMYLESVLQEELALCMMMRSSRTEPPDLTGNYTHKLHVARPTACVSTVQLIVLKLQSISIVHFFEVLNTVNNKEKTNTNERI